MAERDCGTPGRGDAQTEPFNAVTLTMGSAMRLARHRNALTRCLKAIVFCCLHLAAVAAATAALRAEPAAGFEVPLAPTFDWPAPVTVSVVMDVVKKNRTMQSRFDLTTTHDPGDGSITVEQKDFEVLRFEGESVDTPEERARFAPLVALSSLSPGYKVSKEGILLSLVDLDWDAVVSELRARMQSRMSQGPVNEAVLDQMFSRLRSPAMREQMSAAVAEDWNIWVGLWLRAKLATGESLVFTDLVPIHGTKIPQTTVVRHLGSDESCDGCVRLQAESTLEGAEFKTAWVAMIRQMSGSTTQARDQKLEAFIDEIEQAKRVTVVEAVTDPKTLRPASASVETTITLRMRGKPATDQVERRAWTFAWPEKSE